MQASENRVSIYGGKRKRTLGEKPFRMFVGSHPSGNWPEQVFPHSIYLLVHI